jgi:hypothetical protein
MMDLDYRLIVAEADSAGLVMTAIAAAGATIMVIILLVLLVDVA